MDYLLRIQDELTLHQFLNVYYAVDRYTAQILNEQEHLLYESSGLTFEQALRNLTEILPHASSQ